MDFLSPLSSLAFYVFSALAIAFAGLVVLKKNPVSNAFSLVMVFFSFAGIYACLDAHLIATLQILVYAGAIMVLFVFVIMLLNADIPSLDMRRTHMGARIVAGIMCAMLLVAFIRIFKGVTLPAVSGRFTPEFIAQGGGNTQVISELMFSEYILPFELTSVLLLAGIVGAVAIAKRARDKGVEVKS